MRAVISYLSNRLKPAWQKGMVDRSKFFSDCIFRFYRIFQVAIQSGQAAEAGQFERLPGRRESEIIFMLSLVLFGLATVHWRFFQAAIGAV